MPTEDGTRRTRTTTRPAFARVRAHALTVALPLALLLGLGAVLEMAKRAGMLPITIPAPSEVWQSLLNDSDVLIYHLGPTAFAASVGFVASLIVALALAGLASIYRRLEAGIVNSGLVIDSIPLIALTPMLMLWLGKDTASRATIAAIAAFFPMLIGSVQGFKAVKRNAGELFHVMAASPWQRFLKLSVPSALPYLFSALKIAAPVAVLGRADRGVGRRGPRSRDDDGVRAVRVQSATGVAHDHRHLPHGDRAATGSSRDWSGSSCTGIRAAPSTPTRGRDDRKHGGDKTSSVLWAACDPEAHRAPDAGVRRVLHGQSR